MIEIRFRVAFATPFRVASGYGAPGVDSTVDATDPLPASSLKGVMRATAVDLGLDLDLIKQVFGSAKRESPWAWSGAVPVDSWSAPQTASRVQLDEHHTATHDMLAMAEQIVAGAAEFTVTQRCRCGDGSVDEQQALDAHRALLSVSGQATRALGAGRRRGLGWVQIRCLTDTPTRESVGLLLGAVT